MPSRPLRHPARAAGTPLVVVHDASALEEALTRGEKQKETGLSRRLGTRSTQTRILQKRLCTTAQEQHR